MMQRVEIKRIALVAAVAALMGGVTPALGYDGNSKDRSEEYVPRSEYEQMKKMLEQQREDYQQLKKEVEALKQAQQEAAQAPASLEEQTNPADQSVKKAGTSSALEILPLSQITPGWERARAPGWMEPGRLESKSVRIAKMADMDLYMGLDTVGRFQALTQDNVKDTVGADSIASRRLRPDFQTAFGNLSFLADFNKQMEIYFDIFLADKPHQDQLQGDEGYMLIRDLPGPVGDNPWVKAVFDRINVKAGQFETDFGDSHYRRSINAAVQRNPLIGNYLIDPRATEVGMEIYTDEGAFPVNALLGFGSGTDTGDFRKGHQLSVHGKLWANPIEKLRTSASIYAVDHSGNGTSASRTNLFRANRSGGSYGGVFDDGTSPGDITPGAGKKIFATQFDATWEGHPAELYGHVGWFQDSDTNGSTAGTPTESWLYYAVEGIYRLTDRLYAAARYSGGAAGRLASSADSSVDVHSNGLAHRFQVGGGYWLTKTLLLKAEYVYQLFRGFTPNGSQVSGVDAWNDPSFKGIISEVSFSF